MTRVSRHAHGLWGESILTDLTPCLGNISTLNTTRQDLTARSRCATILPPLHTSFAAGNGTIVCPQTQKLCCWRVPTRDCHTGQSLPLSAMGRPHRGALAFLIASRLPAK
uniref:Uncharacterized protein n=1 Tax=Setaria digitata TaxID=48799 RepID=A0A915PMD9_9BILA